MEEDEDREGLPSTAALTRAEIGALPGNGKHVEISERAPLLSRDSKRSLSRSRRRRSSVGPHGDATVTQAVLMASHVLAIEYLRHVLIVQWQLLKAFVGTGILFLGRACVR